MFDSSEPTDPGKSSDAERATHRGMEAPRCQERTNESELNDDLKELHTTKSQKLK